MKRLLLASNDQQLAQALCRLEDCAPGGASKSLQIARVESLFQAWQRLQSETFDVVLLDADLQDGPARKASCSAVAPDTTDPAAQLPGDLFALARRLGEGLSAGKPGLAFVVRAGDLETRRAAWQAGAAEVILRPIVGEELQARLQRLAEAGATASEGQSAAPGADAEPAGQLPALWPALQLLWRLAAAAEDSHTFPVQHVARVGLASRELALVLGHEAAWADLLLWAAPLHDVGNLLVPREILQKPEPLDPEEWAVLQEHCRLGARLLQDDAALWRALAGLPGHLRPKQDVVKLSRELLSIAATAALSHHERWDGTGYPQGLREEEIPLEGRIVAVADVFDSLTSPRPSRGAYDERTALEIMENTAGKLLDPEVYGAFLKALPRIRAIRRELAVQDWQAAVVCGASG